MGKKGAIITALVLLIAGVSGWWFGIEGPKRYQASVKEIKAEMLDYTWVSQDLSEVNLRRVDTQKELTIKFGIRFQEGRTGELPRIESYQYSSGKTVKLDHSEVGEGSIYWLQYAGGEIKDILGIKLIQSRKEWIRKQAISDEIPDISNWDLHVVSVKKNSEAKWGSRFGGPGAEIFCHAYYDTSKETPVLKAMKFDYFLPPEGETGACETIGRKVCIKESGVWKLYRPKKDDYSRWIHALSQKDGSVEFKFQSREERVRDLVKINEIPNIGRLKLNESSDAIKLHFKCEALDRNYIVSFYSLFDSEGRPGSEEADVFCEAYYETKVRRPYPIKEKDSEAYILKVMDVYYAVPSSSPLQEDEIIIKRKKRWSKEGDRRIIARKIWIMRDGHSELIEFTEDDRRDIYAVTQNNGSVEFELR